MTIPHVTLNNGVEMPILGFGVFQIPDPAECERSVRDALDVGYRLLDTAASYGNEAAVGAAITASGIDRKDIFVTTKLWLEDASFDGAKAAVERSLNNLQLDYLDLYLIHQPYGDVYGAWRAMEELHGAGKIRAIGISNFYPDRVMDFALHNRITPAVNQIEINPRLQQPALRAFHTAHGIITQSWTPLGGGHSFAAAPITTAAARTGRTPAQVILRWHIQIGASVIPRSTREAGLRENLNLFDFALSDAEMAAIATLDEGARTGPDPSTFEMQ